MEIEPGKHGVHNARGTRQDPLPVSGNELINVKKRVKIPDALTNAPKVKFQTQVYVEAGLAETPSLIILPVLGYLGGKTLDGFLSQTGSDAWSSMKAKVSNSRFQEV